MDRLRRVQGLRIRIFIRKFLKRNFYPDYFE